MLEIQSEFHYNTYTEKVYMTTDALPGYVPQSTDELILSYENKLTQSIAFKTLEASKKGTSPILTKEELSYLNKKVQRAKDDAQEEVSVITPPPIISLKKGKTEIQVKNATQILQKIDEKYPKNNNTTTTDELKKKISACYATLEKTEPVHLENPTQVSDMKIVNKNAYEIRADVLSMALDWVRYKSGNGMSSTFSDEEVLSTAQKFYSFVENRR